MVCPDWVGHLGGTSAYFGLTVCLGLWLLANVQVDCISLTAVLILDTSKMLLVYWPFPYYVIGSRWE